MAGDIVEVDDAGVAAAPEADDRALAALQFHPDAAGLQPGRFAGLESQLVQPGAGADKDGEGLGRNLEVEGTLITFGHIVETPPAIGQQPDKDIDPAG